MGQLLKSITIKRRGERYVESAMAVMKSVPATIGRPGDEGRWGRRDELT